MEVFAFSEHECAPLWGDSAIPEIAHAKIIGVFTLSKHRCAPRLGDSEFPTG